MKMVSCDMKNKTRENIMNHKKDFQDIQPCHVLGVSKGVRNNLLFLDEETLIYPGGNFCIRYNISEQNQEFLYSAQKGMKLLALALSPDRRYLAVSECGEWGSITIIDLKAKNCPKINVLDGRDYDVREFVCMAFSADSEYLLGQAGGPLGTLYCWQWKEKVLIASVQIKSAGDISQVSFNPNNKEQVCVTGKELFRIYEIRRGALRQANSFKVEKMNILCHTWLSSDCIIAGTDSGDLLILKSRHLQRMGNVYERQTDSSSSLTPQTAVIAIVPYSDGFICATGLGEVILYEKVGKEDSYRKTVTLSIPVEPGSNRPLQTITSMCISPSEQTLAISTDQGQLYNISLNSTELIQNKNTQFIRLSPSFHSGSITGLSVCEMKPLIAISSTDRTVYIWNYHKKHLVQFKQFDEEPRSVSIHPNGLFVLVAFSTQVCLMKICRDDLSTSQTFPINNCTECVFNHNGTKFAAITGNVIHVYNIRSQKKLELSGHNQQVRSLKWSENDRHLVSNGMDSSLFVWDVLTGDVVFRDMESHTTDVTFSPNTGRVLAVGPSHLQEISDQGVLHKLASDGVEYTAVCMAHSGKTVFVGTLNGSIRVINYPFDEHTIWKEHQGHAGPITKMFVTTGDQYLLTASEDGCISMWSIIDQDGQTIDKVKELDYSIMVFCQQDFLDKQDEMMNELTLRIEQLEEEQEMAKTLLDVDYREEMVTVLPPKHEKIKSLKEEVQKLSALKDAEKASYEKKVTELKENCAKEIKDQRYALNEGPSVEYERHEDLIEKTQQMKESYEYMLQKSEENYLCVMEETIQTYEARIEQLKLELEQRFKTFEEEQQRILLDALSEATELTKDYKEDIQKEKELTQKLEEEAALLKEKISEYWKLESLSEDQRTQMFYVDREYENTKKQLRETYFEVDCLRKKKEEQRQMLSDKEIFIRKLHKTIKDQEMHLQETQFKLSSLIIGGEKVYRELHGTGENTEVNKLKQKIAEDKELFSKVEAEMAEADKKHRDEMSGLRNKIKARAREIEAEKQKIRSVEILMERLRIDLRNCKQYIQEPKKLKEKLIEVHRRHCQESDVQYNMKCKMSPAEEVLKDHHKKLENIKRVQKIQQKTFKRKLQAEKKRRRMMETECDYMAEKLYDQRMKHMMNSLNKNDIQCDSTPKPKKRPVTRPQPPKHPKALPEKKRTKDFAQEKKQGQTYPQLKLQGQQIQRVLRKPKSSVKLPPIEPKKKRK